jgi:hypothetical protein
MLTLLFMLLRRLALRVIERRIRAAAAMQHPAWTASGLLAVSLL